LINNIKAKAAFHIPCPGPVDVGCSQDTDNSEQIPRFSIVLFTGRLAFFHLQNSLLQFTGPEKYMYLSVHET
jgi:hypothetical protein